MTKKRQASKWTDTCLGEFRDLLSFSLWSSLSRVLFAAAGVAASVTHLVALEVGGIVDAVFRTGFFAAGRIWTFVTVVGMEVVIYMAVEVLRTMEPATGSNEDTAVEPLGAVVAVGGAVVGSDIVVAVGTVGGWSDLNVDLSVGGRGSRRKSEAGHNRKCKVFKFTHCDFTSTT
jgi:hypothetical protein